MNHVQISYERPFQLPREMFSEESLPMRLEWGKIFCEIRMVMDRYEPVSSEIREEAPEAWAEIPDPPREKWGLPFWYWNLNFYVWNMENQAVFRSSLRSQHTDEPPPPEMYWRIQAAIHGMERNLATQNDVIPLREGDPENVLITGVLRNPETVPIRYNWGPQT